MQTLGPLALQPNKNGSYVFPSVRSVGPTTAPEIPRSVRTTVPVDDIKWRAIRGTYPLPLGQLAGVGICSVSGPMTTDDVGQGAVEPKPTASLAPIAV